MQTFSAVRSYVNQGSILPRKCVHSTLAVHAQTLGSLFRSRQSEMHARAARGTVLDFFDGAANEYVCIFTKDSREALDIVAESYPFSERSSLVLPTDSSTSLMSIRRYVHAAEAEIVYLDTLDQGGFDEYDLRVLCYLELWCPPS